MIWFEINFFFRDPGLVGLLTSKKLDDKKVSKFRYTFEHDIFKLYPEKGYEFINKINRM